MYQVKRNSNFETLRILAMYMIIFIHANMYLGYFCSGKTWLWVNGVVNGICNIGVTCFVLLSGYFGLNFNIKKLLKMECMIIGFSVVETVLLCIFMPLEMQGAALAEQLVKTFCPFITRKYWFYSCYICLFCFSGYINKFVDTLEKKEFGKLIAISILLFSICPTFFYFEIIPDHGKGFVQMVMIYLMGRYIKKFGISRFSRGKEIILFISLWIVNGISQKFPITFGGIWHHFCKDNSITNLVMAVILFCWFKDWKIQSVTVNKMSKNMFAVFALNNSLVTIVMQYVLTYEKFSFIKEFGVVGLIITVFLIMFGCILIGTIRELLLGRIENRILLLIETKALFYYKKWDIGNSSEISAGK